MLLGVILIAILLLDCLAIYFIIKDELSDKKQKLLQSFLVLFIPFLGSLLVILIIKNKPSFTRQYPEETKWEDIHLYRDTGDGRD